MLCKVVRITTPGVGEDWDNSPWGGIPSQIMGNHMGKRPDHFPKAAVKIGYDDMAIHLIFQVEDRYVRAVAKEHQGNVWEDSCVEFFFTPGKDISMGYFNLEINCGGTMLFHFHPGAEREGLLIPKGDCTRIRCTHSLPVIVDPEIKDPLLWRVGCSIPLALVKRYCPVVMPAPRVEWRGNFYKCADKSSHPHWLTWSPVDFPRPDFHLPRFFGILEFQ